MMKGMVVKVNNEIAQLAVLESAEIVDVLVPFGMFLRLGRVYTLKKREDTYEVLKEVKKNENSKRSNTRNTIKNEN